VDLVFAEAKNELARLELEAAVDAWELPWDPPAERHVGHDLTDGIVIEVQTGCGAVQEESRI
jgi:hypothetical protein